MDSISLDERSRDQLAAARESSNGRSSHAIYGGRDHHLRQMLIAMTAGTALGEHESPGEATLQVLEGTVRLSGATETAELHEHDWAPIPADRHDLLAVTDAVVLLTVAKAEHH